MSEDINKLLKRGKISDAINYIVERTECSESDAKEVIEDLRSMQNNMYTANTIPMKKEVRHLISSVPTCPKCGSTSITTGPRGVNFTWGLIGASKTVNRCANCGHTWKPRK